MTDQNNPEQKSEAGWWAGSLTRRELGTAAAVGVAALASAGALQGCCNCGDDDATDGVEQDALEAQKAHGWALGETATTLNFKGGTDTDSKGGADWKGYLDPKTLVATLKPTTAAWRPYERLTLVQSMSQPSLKSQLKPVSIASARKMHEVGLALASLLEASKDPEGTVLIVDMPGPEAVALAAGMAEKVDPVFFFDNWPHPKGVVHSHETLGSLLYYAKELEEKRATREGKSLPVALILDQQRLAAYKDSSDAFDNRYLAELPDGDQLKKIGVTNVLYVTSDPVKEEMDDLNDYMVDYKKDDLKVSSIAMSSFEKDQEAKESKTNGYYYGGHRHSHTYFYTHYPMFFYVSRPYYSTWYAPARAVQPSRVSAPSYSPKARTTMFSGRTTGVTKGVGRSKPTGFGRVSTRVNSSGQVTRSSSRSGRSGSFGRTRSGTSS